MMNRIKAGSYVRFYLNTGTAIQGIVQYIPYNTDECWIIKDNLDNEIRIQNFNYVTQIVPEQSEPNNKKIDKLSYCDNHGYPLT